MSLLDLGNILLSVFEYLDKQPFRALSVVSTAVYHYSAESRIYSQVPSRDIQNNPQRYQRVACQCISLSEVQKALQQWGSRLSSLAYDPQFEQEIPAGFLPDTVRELQFLGYYHGSIHEFLPKRLQRLEIKSRLDNTLTVNFFPATLRVLNLGTHFCQELHPGLLPPNLLELTIDYVESQPIHIGALPAGLIYLHLGGLYRHPLLPKVLPDTLETLILGSSFNSALKPKVLPASLRRLEFGASFDRVWQKSVLPPGLRYLRLGLRYSQDLRPGMLPSGLEHLRVGPWLRHIQPSALPANLQVLEAEIYQHNTPPSFPLPATAQLKCIYLR